MAQLSKSQVLVAAGASALLLAILAAAWAQDQELRNGGVFELPSTFLKYGACQVEKPLLKLMKACW